MADEKMREEFEAWCGAHFVFGGFELNRSPDGNYSNVDILLAWQSWQASRAAIEVELPSLRAITMGRRENEHDSGFNAGVELCIDAIESLGLKVKP